MCLGKSIAGSASTWPLCLNASSCYNRASCSAISATSRTASSTCRPGITRRRGGWEREMCRLARGLLQLRSGWMGFCEIGILEGQKRKKTQALMGDQSEAKRWQASGRLPAMEIRERSFRQAQMAFDVERPLAFHQGEAVPLAYSNQIYMGGMQIRARFPIKTSNIVHSNRDFLIIYLESWFPGCPRINITDEGSSRVMARVRVSVRDQPWQSADLPFSV